MAASPWSATPDERAGAFDPVDLAGAAVGGGGAGLPHGGGTRFTGVARDVQQRQYGENAGWTRLEFRIERHDPSGNRLAPVPVEMEGVTHRFRGTVSNGDEIRITHGKWHGGTLRVDELDNLTTGAEVRTRLTAEERAKARDQGLRVLAVIAAIVMGILIIVVTLQ